MILDLSTVLNDAEKLKPGDTICPLMSRYDVSQGALQKSPDLLSFTVICVKEKCGMFASCTAKGIAKP